ncbi:hypothetical protein DFH28DRAFT_1131353 [Melampsora americana]|nr:hypothetical protein DFH28DRAFT_1131353 [Melampsora americana]
MKSNSKPIQNQIEPLIDSNSQSNQTQSSSSSTTTLENQNQLHSKPSSPIILLPSHESTHPDHHQLNKSTQSYFQNHTLLINEDSTDKMSNHSNLIFGSTSNLITEEPQSTFKSINPTNSTDSDKPVDRLDPTVVEAMMTGTVRDKQILLQAEVEMVRFVTSTQHRQPFGAALSTSLNSYQRMLVHRLGDSFGIKRSMDLGHMYMERTPSSACPLTRLDSFIIRQDASPSNTAVSPQERSPSLNIPQEEKTTPITSSQNTNDVKVISANPSNAPLKTFKIMSRTPSQRSNSRQTNNKGITPSTGSSVSSSDATNSDNKRNELSYEARQAAYQQARNRIFASETSESAEDDGINKEPSESEATTSSRNVDGSVNDDSNADSSITSSKEASLGNGPIRIAQALNKGKEKMTANLRSAKQAAAAKLRPGATAFDPNAKAHGYEEVTIIDFDDSHGPIPWTGPNGYGYPSEPISRQTYNSRHTRPGHLYGGDAFPATLPVQHHPPCGTLNGEQTQHDVTYGMFSPSNGPHYIDSQLGSHPASGMNPMLPYEHPPQRMFPPPSGPMEGDHHRQLYPQNPGFPAPTSSISNGRSINPGTSIPPGPRIPTQHDRFNPTPYTAQHGVDNEMGVGRGTSSETTGIPMMMGNQGSDRMRGTYISPDPHSAPPRSLTAPPPPEGHQGMNFAHSMSYPSLHQISQNHNPLPPLHMNPYQTNHHPTSNSNTFDATFQTSSQPPISPINPPLNRESNGTSSKHPIHLNNHQFHPSLNSMPSYSSDPSHPMPDYSQVDRRPIQNFNGNGLHHLGSNLHPTSMNSFLPVPLKFESSSHTTYQSSSSISSTSTDSSNRTAASSLSRQMNGMKINESTSKSIKPISRSNHVNQIGIFVGEKGRSKYPRSPASVGNLSTSSAGSSRMNQVKKNPMNCKSAVEEDEVRLMEDEVKVKDLKVKKTKEEEEEEGLKKRMSSMNELRGCQSYRPSLDHGLNPTTNESLNEMKGQKSKIGILQHPLPIKPSWTGSNQVNVRNHGNGKHRNSKHEVNMNSSQSNQDQADQADPNLNPSNPSLNSSNLNLISSNLNLNSSNESLNLNRSNPTLLKEENSNETFEPVSSLKPLESNQSIIITTSDISDPSKPSEPSL